MRETIIKILETLGLVSVIFVAGFLFGSNHGKLEVQHKWDNEKLGYQEQIAELQRQVIIGQAIHAKKLKQVEDKLREADQTYTKAIAAGHREYNARLQQSEARSKVYQRAAEGSPVERDNLARHAAELDRSLEEGRSLVRELGETLRLRDTQLQQVGEQLINDRNLFTGQEDDRQANPCAECVHSREADELDKGAEHSRSEVRLGAGSTVSGSAVFEYHPMERPSECSWCSKAEDRQEPFEHTTEADSSPSRVAILSTYRTLPWFGETVQG